MLKSFFATGLIFCLPLLSLCQKVKNDGTLIKYFRPATYHSSVSNYYNIHLKEVRTEQDGSISEKDIFASPKADDRRGSFYWFEFSSLQVSKQQAFNNHLKNQTRFAN